MAKRLFMTLTCIAILAGILGPVCTYAADVSAPPQEPEITSVSVDGVQYSLEEFELLFGNEPLLHWVVDHEAEAEGRLIAFTTEENRDAALGIQLLAEDEALTPEGTDADDEARTPAGMETQDAGGPRYPRLFDGKLFSGEKLIVLKTTTWLGRFNDRASSVVANQYGIVLYEHANFNHYWDGKKHKGCTLTLSPYESVKDLGKIRRCHPFHKWDNSVSSVRLFRVR